MAGEGTVLRFDLESAWTLDYTNGLVAQLKGDTFIHGELVVFLLDVVAIGGTVGACFGAEKALFPKTAGLAVAQGMRVFWAEATKAVTVTVTDRAIGWCQTAALAGDDDILINFHQEVESTTY